MFIRRPHFAVLALFVLALLPIAGALASGGVCTDDCGPDCGDCIVCGQAGPLSSPFALSPALATRVARPSTGLAPEALAVRTIEHVPLLAS